MSRGRSKRFKSSLPFAQLFKWVLASPAWVHLSPSAKATYVRLKTVYNGSNNGELALSARDAGEWLSHGDGKSIGARALTELAEHGFVVIQVPSSFRTNSRRAAAYALTEARNDVTGQPGSREFMRWRAGYIFNGTDWVPEAGAGIKTPVPQAGHSVPQEGRKRREDAEVAA